MFTVTTPYKYASAMFRLTSLGMQMQMSAYRALSGVPIAGTAEVGEQFQSQRKTSTSRKKATAAAKAKPNAKQSGKRTRKPSKPPALPEVTSEKAEDGLNNMPV